MAKAKKQNKRNTKAFKKNRTKSVKKSTMNVLDTFMQNSNLASNVTHYLPDGTTVTYRR